MNNFNYFGLILISSIGLCFSGQISFTIKGNVDSIVLHHEDLRFCTSADTIDSCEAKIDSVYYSQIISEIAKIRHSNLFEMGDCCGEKKIACLEIFTTTTTDKKNIEFYSEKSMKINFWGCKNDKGYLYINDNLFVVDFSDSLQNVFKRIINRNKVRVITLRGLNRIKDNRAYIMQVVTPYLNHVHDFDVHSIDMIERPKMQKIYQMPEAALANLRFVVNRFKQEVDNYGLIAIWDTSKFEYSLKWKDSLNIK